MRKSCFALFGLLALTTACNQTAKTENATRPAEKGTPPARFSTFDMKHDAWQHGLASNSLASPGSITIPR